MAKGSAASPEAASSGKGSRKQRTASREIRSASPAKMAQPIQNRPKASPKKRSRKANGVKASEEAEAASKALKKALGDDIEPSVADSDDEAATAAIVEAAAPGASAEDVADAIAVVNGDEANDLDENTARVTVTKDVVNEGEAETTRTSVKIEMPVGSPEQPIPESPEDAIQQAKEIVEAAKDLSPAAEKKSRKRKVEALEVENPEEELVEEVVENGEAAVVSETMADANGEVEFGARTEEPPSKRQRVMVPAEDFRRKKMQTRALMGLSATVAVG